MEHLPQDLIFELFSKLAASDILSLCSTNKQLVAICHDENLWSSLLRTRFPQYVNKKPSNMTYREFYIKVSHLKPLAIYHQQTVMGDNIFGDKYVDQYIGDVWINANKPLRMFISDIINYVKKLGIFHFGHGAYRIYFKIDDKLRNYAPFDKYHHLHVLWNDKSSNINDIDKITVDEIYYKFLDDSTGHERKYIGDDYLDS